MASLWLHPLIVYGSSHTWLGLKTPEGPWNEFFKLSWHSSKVTGPWEKKWKFNFAFLQHHSIAWRGKLGYVSCRMILKRLYNKISFQRFNYLILPRLIIKEWERNETLLLHFYSTAKWKKFLKCCKRSFSSKNEIKFLHELTSSSFSILWQIRLYIFQ